MAGLPGDDPGTPYSKDTDATENYGSEETPPVNPQDLSGSLECPICLQPCMHPVELPCHHVFCFLCIKGVAMQGPNSRCAICRATIPITVLTNPQLKDISQLYKEPKLANGYQWYYESRSGGWWQYDERTMQELERAFSSKQPSCQLLLAGHLYMVDFNQMIQYRSNNRNVSRRIRREINLEKRGVAGIRIASNNTGDGTTGGTNGSPPASHNPGSSGRRRRGASSATSSVQAASASGNASSATGAASLGSPLLNLGGQSQSPDASRRNDNLVTDSDDDSVDEDEDYDSDYSAGDDVDDDMELGEEEEALIGDESDEQETEDEEEHDTRDGARAPTRRSDRSNSSNNQTPPPPSGGSVTNGTSSRTYSPNPSSRGSRAGRNGRSSGGGRSSNGNGGAASRATSMGLSDQISISPQPIASSNSNVLACLFYNRCNLDDIVTKNNVSNNNIYVDTQIIGQVNYGVSQSLNSITTSAATVKITLDKRNQEECL